MIGSLEDVAERLRDGQRIGLGGFWFVRTPIALVDAVLESGVRDLEIVCFGGGLGVERLIAEKRVRTLYFSFNSMDVLGPAPMFRAALESGAVQGVELTTLIMAKALRAAEENLPFLPIRGPEGSAFTGEPYALPLLDDPVSGQALRAVPALPLDMALVHGTRADTCGNVEIVGAHGLDLRILGAAKDRVVSVEEIVEPFRGPEAAHRTTIPRFLVDTVVPIPEGAKPGSCLPYYPSSIPDIDRELGGDPASGAPAAIPLLTRDDDEPSNAELLITTLSRQIVDGGVYTVGSVTPISMVAYQLAKLTHAPNMAIIPFAGMVDVDFFPAAIAGAEPRALENGHGFWGMEDLYELLYQAGRIDAEIFCPAQIDRYGDINNSLVLRDERAVRLPGQAGIADVAAMHRNLYMYVPRHSPSRLVGSLDFRGGSRYLVADDERAAAGFLPGEVTLVSDLCVFRQNKSSRLLEVESVHPGVEVERVIEQTGFPVDVPADPARTITPDRETLDILRRVVDPYGVRDIETVPSAQRRSLLYEILRREANSPHPERT